MNIFGSGHPGIFSPGSRSQNKNSGSKKQSALGYQKNSNRNPDYCRYNTF
jgi:hypothetical protein